MLTTVSIPLLVAGFVLQFLSENVILPMVLLGVGLSILSLAAISSFYQSASEPLALFITLLGVGRTGKTVYLGVLFDLLRRWKSKEIVFRPYGDETITMMTDIMNTLARCSWPSPTPHDSVFPFRAQVRYSSAGRNRHYKIFIPDYAGDKTEHFVENEGEPLLHKSPFFRQVVESDAVILVADGAILSGGTTQKIRIHENNLMAAVSRLADVKGGRRGKIRAPIAIVVTKADLYEESESAEIWARLRRLVELCEETCERFEVFEVSSVGGVDEVGDPLEQFQPRHVVDPIMWLLVQLSALPMTAYTKREEAVFLDAEPLSNSEEGD